MYNHGSHTLYDFRCIGSYTPQGGPPSYPRTQESTAAPSDGSPPSAAPSPLQNPNSQPASVPLGDQTMPTLSPHPPTANPSPADKTHTPDQPLKSMESNQNSPGSAQDQKPDCLTNQPSVVVLKRPLLTSKEYEAALGEEEQTLEMLYDYSTLDAWLNHPVKKFKPDSKDNQNLQCNRFGKLDIYSWYDNNFNVNQSSDTAAAAKSAQIVVKQEIKQEPGLELENAAATLPLPHGIKRPGDPYEFEEEGASNCNMDGFKRGQVGIKEEKQEVKKTTDSLFTSEGLQPSIKDLDQIFDNSDNSSSDEAVSCCGSPFELNK